MILFCTPFLSRNMTTYRQKTYLILCMTLQLSSNFQPSPPCKCMFPVRLAVKTERDKLPSYVDTFFAAPYHRVFICTTYLLFLVLLWLWGAHMCTYIMTAIVRRAVPLCYAPQTGAAQGIYTIVGRDSSAFLFCTQSYVRNFTPGEHLLMQVLILQRKHCGKGNRDASLKIRLELCIVKFIYWIHNSRRQYLGVSPMGLSP